MTLWEIVFVLVILKIPVAYVGWVIWWAVKAEPEIGAEGGMDGISWRPWLRPSPDAPRPRRGGPHGAPVRAMPRGGRSRERARGAGA